MDHLRRGLAPISDEAWAAIDAEAVRTLRHFLAGRPLIDVTGPHGWTHSAEPLGRAVSAEAAVVEGVQAALRTSQPLVELRTPFELPMAELDAIDRGAPDPDLTALQDAARLAALAEDHLVFHGYQAAGIPGLTGASPHDPLEIGEDYDDYAGVVARAVAELRRAGVGGPYAIALGPRCYTGVIETSEHGGYPLLEHLKLIVGGPLVWAPAVDGAVVVSQRGGDYELISGEDLSIGYLGRDDDAVHLYFEESLTLLVKDDRAAIALRYAD
jgi:uncharacterized linocin/CFP29 family protein